MVFLGQTRKPAGGTGNATCPAIRDGGNPYMSPYPRRLNRRGGLPAVRADRHENFTAAASDRRYQQPAAVVCRRRMHSVRSQPMGRRLVRLGLGVAAAAAALALGLLAAPSGGAKRSTADGGAGSDIAERERQQPLVSAAALAGRAVHDRD